MHFNFMYGIELSIVIVIEALSNYDLFNLKPSN